MFKHVDMGSAMRRLAERKIEEAISAGKFDHLEGAGKPLELEPMPADENARMLWWAIRLLRKNDVVPDEFKYRKAIDALIARVRSASSEAELATLVPQVNELIRRLNTMGTGLGNAAYVPLDLEAERSRLRTQRESREP